MADEPIRELRLWRLGLVLADGNGRNVTMAAPVQIARRRVVEGVIAAPLIERRERQHAGDVAYDVIHAARLEQ